MTTEDDLAVELVASAVLRDNDLTLRIAAARLLNFEPMVPLTFAYRVAERILRATQPAFGHIISTNGDGTAHDDN